MAASICIPRIFTNRDPVQRETFYHPSTKMAFYESFLLHKKPLNASHYKHWPIVVPAPFLVSARGKEIKMGELSF